MSGPFRRFLKNRSQILGFFFGFQKIVPAACLKPARNQEKGRHMPETGTKFGKESGRPKIIEKAQNHREGPKSSGRPGIIRKARNHREGLIYRLPWAEWRWGDYHGVYQKVGANVIENQRIVIDNNVVTSFCPETAADVAFQLLIWLVGEENAAVVSDRIIELRIRKERALLPVQNIV